MEEVIPVAPQFNLELVGGLNHDAFASSKDKCNPPPPPPIVSLAQLQNLKSNKPGESFIFLLRMRENKVMTIKNVFLVLFWHCCESQIFCYVLKVALQVIETGEEKVNLSLLA